MAEKIRKRRGFWSMPLLGPDYHWPFPLLDCYRLVFSGESVSLDSIGCAALVASPVFFPKTAGKVAGRVIHLSGNEFEKDLGLFFLLVK